MTIVGEIQIQLKPIQCRIGNDHFVNPDVEENKDTTPWWIDDNTDEI